MSDETAQPVATDPVAIFTARGYSMQLASLQVFSSQTGLGIARRQSFLTQCDQSEFQDLELDSSSHYFPLRFDRYHPIP